MQRSAAGGQDIGSCAIRRFFHGANGHYELPKWGLRCLPYGSAGRGELASTGSIRSGLGASMRFGKFHGWVLLAFGALLLLLQTFVILESRSVSSTKTLASERRAETESRPAVARLQALEYLPGAVGIVAAAIGATVLVQQQRRILQQESEKEARDYHSSGSEVHR
jgi:heme exporter protein D